ncbi:hypothetical protein CQW23_12773 [Capsicum baccatum]|uniref:Uncharacterized protein n=1 Tax=Capsicum baccatum TaxID=33114 RepID=A0A2G2WTJ3_CAPBA|nr:hypothetical protein CQW23_12773 [Capsicum baccatum]
MAIGGLIAFDEGITEAGCKGARDESLGATNVSCVVLRKDIVNLLEFIERLKTEEDHTDRIERLKLELKFLSACLQLCYYISNGSDVEMSSISYEVHDLLVELLNALLSNLQYLPKVRTELILPSRIHYELLQNVFGHLRDLHNLIINGCIEHNVCRVNSKLANLLAEVIAVEMEAMHICFTILTASMSVEVERFLMQLIESSPRILTKSLIHLQLHMVNAITHSTSACNTHVMIEFLLTILADVPLDVIRPDKLFVFLVLKHLPRRYSFL